MYRAAVGPSPCATTLNKRHSNEAGLSSTRAGFTRTLGTGVNPDAGHSLSSAGNDALVAFMPSAMSRVRVFTTNSPVSSMFLSVSLPPPFEFRTTLKTKLGGAAPPAIVRTVATRDEGTADLLDAVQAFHRQAEASGALAAKRRAQLRRLLEDAVRERVMAHVFRQVVPPAELDATVERLAARTEDPFTAAESIVRRMGLA